MGYSKYAELVLGWKLAGMPTNYKGERLSPYEDEFMPYVEGHKGIEETIIYDQMCGDYVVFGKLLGHVYDCGDFETIDVSGLDTVAMRDRFRDIFDAEAPEEDPKVLLFIHCS